MKSNRIFNSKIYRFLDYILRLILLNLLIVIPSFSFLIIVSNVIEDKNSSLVYISLIPTLLWFIPSLVATTDVIKQFEVDKTNTVFKDFFKSLKRHYIKSLILSLLIYGMGYLLLNSVSFFLNYATQSLIYIVGLMLSISFLIMLLVIIIHVILVMVYFNALGVIEIVKLACIMAFKEIVLSIGIVILIVLLISLGFAYYIVMAAGCMSVACYAIVKLTIKKYIRIYHKIKEKNE